MERLSKRMSGISYCMCGNVLGCIYSAFRQSSFSHDADEF